MSASARSRETRTLLYIFLCMVVACTLLYFCFVLIWFACPLTVSPVGFLLRFDVCCRLLVAASHLTRLTLRCSLGVPGLAGSDDHGQAVGPHIELRPLVLRWRTVSAHFFNFFGVLFVSLVPCGRSSIRSYRCFGFTSAVFTLILAGSYACSACTSSWA